MKKLFYLALTIDQGTLTPVFSPLSIAAENPQIDFAYDDTDLTTY